MRTEALLKIYSGVVTAALCVMLLGGFARDKGRVTMDEINVHRINVVEPDGTIRMVISNRASFPGIFVKGKEYPHPDRSSAGMLFFNDEGTENGGLIFGGHKDKSGRTESYGHLSFDRYEQDQTLTLDADEEGEQRHSGIRVLDQPDYSISDLLTTPRADWEKFVATHPKYHARVYLGRENDRSAALRLKDAQGRDRIVIRVTEEGTAAIQFLDESGRVVREVGAK